LRLPNLDGKDSLYHPLKFGEYIKNSESLKFDYKMAWHEKKKTRKSIESDLDSVLQTIKEKLILGT